MNQVEEISQEEKSPEKTNNLDDIPIVESTSMFDATKFEGMRVKVDNVEKKQVTDFFPDGSTYKKDSTDMKWVVEITTEPLREIDNDGQVTDKIIEMPQEDGTHKNLRVTKRFNLQEQLNNETGKPEVVISKHPKASLWKFMRKMGTDSLSGLKGKVVTLTSEPSKVEGDDRRFLSIVV